MKLEKGARIKLISFWGTLSPEKTVDDQENYWKLIGERGKVIDHAENHDQKVLIVFDNDLDKFKVENHNPIKNSLWIKETDLEIE